MLWLIISTGIYLCGSLFQNTKDGNELAENETEKKEEIVSDSEANTDTDTDTAEISDKEALSDHIRVLIKTDYFNGIYHNRIDEFISRRTDFMLACLFSSGVASTSGSLIPALSARYLTASLNV